MINKIIRICDVLQNIVISPLIIICRQKFALPMGSPFSDILAHFSLEFLQTDLFQIILPKASIYF